MIKLNLLGDETVVDTSGIWLVLAYCFSFAILAISLGGYYLSLQSSVSNMRLEVESLEKRLASIREVTKEVRALEQKKKDLAEKTAVIAILKRSKLGPVKMMDDLNLAIPERAWLSEIKESGGNIRISGFALDNQTVALFMENLEKSSFLNRVDLSESRAVEKDGIKISAFGIQAQINYAGFTKKGVKNDEVQSKEISEKEQGEKEEIEDINETSPSSSTPLPASESVASEAINKAKEQSTTADTVKAITKEHSELIEEN
jgi:type IV pilus assembly protein PilN